mmetsp:Transcript_100145/g.282596  ORF Transcript_100145/g.282596 Transcript_100145/m.282596 type:complete len:315 (+) Transcript_100145:263-1207(+)
MHRGADGRSAFRVLFRSRRQGFGIFGFSLYRGQCLARRILFGLLRLLANDARPLGGSRREALHSDLGLESPLNLYRLVADLPLFQGPPHDLQAAPVQERLERLAVPAGYIRPRGVHVVRNPQALGIRLLGLAQSLLLLLLPLLRVLVFALGGLDLLGECCQSLSGGGLLSVLRRGAHLAGELNLLLETCHRQCRLPALVELHHGVRAIPLRHRALTIPLQELVEQRLWVRVARHRGRYVTRLAARRQFACLAKAEKGISVGSQSLADSSALADGGANADGRAPADGSAHADGKDPADGSALAETLADGVLALVC